MIEADMFFSSDLVWENQIPLPHGNRLEWRQCHTEDGNVYNVTIVTIQANFGIHFCTERGLWVLPLISYSVGPVHGRSMELSNNYSNQ